MYVCKAQVRCFVGGLQTLYCLMVINGTLKMDTYNMYSFIQVVDKITISHLISISSYVWGRVLEHKVVIHSSVE